LHQDAHPPRHAAPMQDADWKQFFKRKMYARDDTVI
jgi:hypothetical protein